MQRRIAFFITQIVISVVALSYSLTAKAANHYVYIDYDLGPDPDPVNIYVNDSVYFYDGDGFGPYEIYFNASVDFYTPGGVTFMGAGTYSYFVFDFFGDFVGTGSVVASVPQPNYPPSVTITSPTNNAVFVAPAAFTFAADATDPNANDLAGVDFFLGGSLVDFIYYPPYETTITNLAAGTYELKAIAYDYSNATATNKITIQVVNPGPITVTGAALGAGNFRFTANGLVPGRLTVLQESTNLKTWTSLSTNAAPAVTRSFTNTVTAGSHFYRVIQLP